MNAVAPTTQSANPSPNNPTLKADGWKARLELGYRARNGKTQLAHKRQYGPLTVQRPFYPEGGVCHTYLLHPPGGVVAGDLLDIEVTTEPDAHALITTPGATKFYRSNGELAMQRQTLTIAAGSSLEWLPQEAIFFPSTHAKLETEIRLESGGQFIGWEMGCLGRPSVNERFEQGRVDTLLKLYRDDELLLVDQLRTQGEAMSSSPSGLRDKPMFATLIATGVTPELFETLQQTIHFELNRTELILGATLLEKEILVVRALAERTEHILSAYSQIWQALRPELLGLKAELPRIWAT